MSKVLPQHLEKSAYVYVRQSTMGQVRDHQESTERQYAFKDSVQQLGWPAERVRILDGDLGVSGAHTTGRQDFKTLVADVSMGQVGAVVSLEASRLARSSADWHRLIEICAITGTVIVDEDGCYDPRDFNDALLLGLKGTMSQAELHFLRGRLQGGLLNSAKKGELRLSLPVGYCHDDVGAIVLDPDEQVQAVIQLVFSVFRETGTAYGVAAAFRRRNLSFPKRAYGGVWAGKLIWGRLTYSRVVGVLRNPAYAGIYVYGRSRAVKSLSAAGEIQRSTKSMPEESWHVRIEGHHEGYITSEEFMRNQAILESNQPTREKLPTGGPPREGCALLQGLLLCGKCGKKLQPVYKGTGGRYPAYECSAGKSRGLLGTRCLAVRCETVDPVVSTRVLEILQPAQLEMAVVALAELERRDEAAQKQWRMHLQRAEYQAQLAEKRYEEVDPSNRLVARTLERRWNEALAKQADIQRQFEEHRAATARVATPEQRERVLALAQDFPGLWNAPTTQAREKKRMLRLLLQDITVEKDSERRLFVLHVRWQGGALEDLLVPMPPTQAEVRRYPEQVVERVRQEISLHQTDAEIAATLNQEGLNSAMGKPFNAAMIQWIRHSREIPVRQPGELSVAEVAERFGVRPNVIYYWIEHGKIAARRSDGRTSPYWLTVTDEQAAELKTLIRVRRKDKRPRRS
jgi:DNA invertase Pin-like site-specific DNA recombinase